MGPFTNETVCADNKLVPYSEAREIGSDKVKESYKTLPM
jgi:hypothetical protein